MIPILYEAVWHDIDLSWGPLKLGWLTDTISCSVEENRNGEYFLEMTYPVSGELFSKIELKKCIYAPHDASGKWDLFRINKISKPLNGIVEITACHLSYDMDRIAVVPFSVVDADADTTLRYWFKPATTGILSFDYSSDITTSANFSLEEPCTARELLFDNEGSFVDVYGGEWSYDMWSCKLNKERGSHKDIWIRYGKNLNDLTQEMDDSDQYTAVLGYWKGTQEDSSGTTVDVVQVGDYQASSYYNTAPRIKVVDFSSEFSEKPSKSELNEKAKSYLNSNKGWIYTDSLTVEFVEEDSELNDLVLCDWVHVFYEEFDINTELEVIKTTWNVLLNRYDSIELGSKQLTLSDTISGIYKKVNR